MTRAEVVKLLRLWQRLLGLELWTIKFDPTVHAGDDCNARTWRSNEYERAAVWLGEGWEEKPGYLVEAYLVHELLHLQHRDVDEAAKDLYDQVHRDAHTLFERRFEHETEGFIERLALKLVELRHGKRFDWTVGVEQQQP